MFALTKVAFQSAQLSNRHCEVHMFDEISRAGRVQPEKIMRRYRDATVIVGLVGVQTNMFPRACDLAHRFKSLDAIVVVGGFHVSGSITTMYDGQDGLPSPRIMPPECQQLMDDGIIIFHGEAETQWHRLLIDICQGQYDLLYRGGWPSILEAEQPEFPDSYFNGFITRHYTLDTCRGCPYHCKFCTIIQVQGHDVRFRDPQSIVDWVQRICDTYGRIHIFVTDDNFGRNPRRDEILDGLSELQESGYSFSFMIEADLKACLDENFIRKLSQAGCNQIFMGVESVNQATLKAEGKHQNKVKLYAETCRLINRYGLTTHAGYIIGFRSDTPETIRKDVETLKAMGFNHASFFILTPLPGSEDHIRWYCDGVTMDDDFNNYDSFQPVMDHPLMSPEELQQAYHNAWHQFYTKDHMKATLRRIAPHNYWGHMINFMWYRWSALHENIHPMIAGLYRYRRYRDRRSSSPRISRIKHLLGEIRRHVRYIGSGMQEFLVFQEVYFETRWLPVIAEKVAHLNLAERPARVRELVRVHEPNRGLILQKAHWVTRTFGAAASRDWLNAFWRKYGSQKWNLLVKWHWHVRIIPHVVSEVIYSWRFGWTLFRTVAQGSHKAK
jgi:radical SAM superfamily enzyme YgiQ (UPF0313 family)